MGTTTGIGMAFFGITGLLLSWRGHEDGAAKKGKEESDIPATISSTGHTAVDAYVALDISLAQPLS